MNSIDIQYSKTHFSELLERVLLGEVIVIAKADRPVARRAPFPSEAHDRRPGSARGGFVVPPDFDAPLPDDVLTQWG